MRIIKCGLITIRKLPQQERSAGTRVVSPVCCCVCVCVRVVVVAISWQRIKFLAQLLAAATAYNFHTFPKWHAI